MSKLLILPSSLKQIDDLLLDVDGFILSIECLSINSSFYIKLSEIDKIILKLKKHQKEVFISLNKNMFNNDLNFLEDALKKLSHFDISGILYYDISVLSIAKRLNLNLSLVWSQEHLTTNYLTCNYYYEKGCKYVYLSSEITLNEILEIKEKTKLLTIVPIFGYLPMFASKRHVVKNYLDSFNLKEPSTKYFLEKENKNYPIIDNDLEVTVYSSDILNGLDEYLILKQKKIDYVTLNSFNIKEEQFKTVVSLYKTVTYDNKDNYNHIIDRMFSNIDKGFLYKETIYKVKKSEKDCN